VSAADPTWAAAGPRLDEQPAARLLVSMYGDYWFGSTEYVPSRSLVALLGELGVAETATRAALSRLARRGCLEGRKQGRHTAYRFTTPSRTRVMWVRRALLRFGSAPRDWDGQWTCVAFSVPEADRHLRPALRRRLRGLRLGPLFDGLWITAAAPLAAIEQSLAELAVTDAAVFRAREVPLAAGVDLLSAWDLAGLRAGYDDLVRGLEGLRGQIRRGRLSRDDAVVARATVMVRWRMLVRSDPRLPDELLPRDWPLRRAQRAVVAAYDALAPLSQDRARALVGTDAGGPATPRVRSVAEVLADHA